MTIDEQIEVMQHFRDGGDCDCTYRDSGDWIQVKDPHWNFALGSYRKKPEKKFIPWTAETIPFTLAVREKTWPVGEYVLLINVYVASVFLATYNHTSIKYSDLLEDWETRDGGVCGEVVGDE